MTPSATAAAFTFREFWMNKNSQFQSNECGEKPTVERII